MDIIFGCIAAIFIIYFAKIISEVKSEYDMYEWKTTLEWILVLIGIYVGIQLICASLALYAVKAMKSRLLIPYLLFLVNVFRTIRI